MDAKSTQQRFVSIGKAAVLTGLDRQTLRKMADQASLVCYKTPSGTRRIDIQSLQAMCAPTSSVETKHPIQKQNFLYARVSTKTQMDDLSRQIAYLRRPNYVDYVPLEDVGSGINFKRKGLSTILDACVQRNIGEIVVAHRDRLCRFGYELLDSLVTKAGGKITVLDSSPDKTSEQELADDLLAIIHVFSCKQMEKRSYRQQKQSAEENSIHPYIPKLKAKETT
jgi:predicted site-specific integrase-resolvase